MSIVEQMESDARVAVLEAKGDAMKESLDEVKDQLDTLDEKACVQHTLINGKLEKIENHLSKQSGYIAGIVTATVAFWSVVVLLLTTLWDKIWP